MNLEEHSAVPQEESGNSPTICSNCKAQLAGSESFCPRCAQSTRPFRWSLLDWLYEWLNSTFHFEGRTLKTLRDLFIPGKLASGFFQGQRQSYLHPLRILLLSSLLLFAAIQLIPQSGGKLINFNVNDSPEIEVDLTNSDEEDFPLSDSVDNEDVLDDSLTADTIQEPKTDSLLQPELTIPPTEIPEWSSVEPDTTLQARADKAWNKVQDLDKVRAGIWSNAMIDVYEAKLASDNRLSPELSLHFDSLSRLLLDTALSVYRINLEMDLPYGETVLLKSEEIAVEDPQILVEKSGLKYQVNKLLLLKTLRFFNDGGENIATYFESRLSWIILLFTPFFALVYWAHYWRRLRYYTQHLCYVALLISAILITWTLLALFSLLKGTMILLTLLIFWVFVLFSDKRVYGRSWMHTIVKSLSIGMFGILTMGITMFLWLILTVLIY